jgi:hypothetical protein
MVWAGWQEGDEERPLVAATARLIADTEAFVSGDYADHLRRHGDMVPGWARLNLLAHSDLERLRRARLPFSSRKPALFAKRTGDAWRSAIRVLADELIEVVESDSEMLSYVQRCALVPLELELMHEVDLTAFELVQFTRAALRSVIR